LNLEYYECFLFLLGIFRDGAKSFFEAVVLSTFTRWEELQKQWAHEMFEELLRVVPVPFTLI